MRHYEGIGSELTQVPVLLPHGIEDQMIQLGMSENACAGWKEIIRGNLVLVVIGQFHSWRLQEAV